MVRALLDQIRRLDNSEIVESELDESEVHT